MRMHPEITRLDGSRSERHFMRASAKIHRQKMASIPPSAGVFGGGAFRHLHYASTSLSSAVDYFDPNFTFTESALAAFWNIFEFERVSRGCSNQKAIPRKMSACQGG